MLSQDDSGIVNFVQGYAKTYLIDLFYEDTGEPFDLTGATQIKAAHPGTIGGTGPVVEYLNNAVGTTTGNPAIGSPVITGLASVAGLTPGLNIAGTGIPGGSIVLAVAPGQVTISQNATATGTGVTLTFTGTGVNVSVVGAPGAGKVQVKVPAPDAVNLLINPSLQQFQDLQVVVTNSGGTTPFLLQAVLNIQAPPYGVQ